MGKEIVAMILAGGRGTRLKELTAKVAKPAVYFGGKYRIIDFPLSLRLRLEASTRLLIFHLVTALTQALIQ